MLWAQNAAGAAAIPQEVSQRFADDGVVEVIVEYDATTLERELSQLRARLPRRVADDALLSTTRERYRLLKDAADRAVPPLDTDTLADYSHLPMRALRVRSARALAALAAHPNLRAIYANGTLQRVLAQSLPLIGQPAAQAAGYGGAGTTVAVIDDGIDITNPAFGCSGVATPAECRIAAVQTIASTPGADFTHGTNVSAIVTGVAAEARVAMLNVFSASGASFSDVITGINWSIANRSAYNIVAINMSLGDTSHSTSACKNGNSFTTPVANARAAGISVVAAAGNVAYVNNTFTPGLSKPACTPGVISVGAVYDSNVGGLIWGSAPNQCTDNTSQADQVVCFSQSAPILTLLAPGAMITAAGITEGGTSQASPHAAGAVAILRAAFPGDTVDATLARLITSGVQIADPRSGVTKPRLSLADAARPANDAFAARQSVNGASGNTSGVNLLATREAGEPDHAAPGGASVWWTWTAPSAGQLTLSSAGSDFDTLLGVYTGNAVAALTPVASNDNAGVQTTTSQVLFQAQAGTTYQWAVDGAGGADGHINLQWGLNTAAKADLSASISGPASVSAGATVAYAFSVRNAGPQTATGVRLNVSLPAGVTYVSGPAQCLATAATVTCTVAALAGGDSASWTLLLNITDPGAGLALSASVSSDLPDPAAADNAIAKTVLPVTGGGATGDGDVPLPLWALALLAVAMAGAMARAGRAT